MIVMISTDIVIDDDPTGARAPRPTPPLNRASCMLLRRFR